MISRLLATGVFTLVASCFGGEVLKAGIIGADTSHAVEYAQLLNAADATGDLAGIKVVAVFPGGSADIAASKDRVAGYTEKLRNMGVEVVDSIDALLPKVDVVLLESLDGRPHLKQMLPVLNAKKPVFIDKPLAATLADVSAIFQLAEKLKVPCFSSSALRFGAGIATLASDPRAGKVLGCEAYSPCTLEPHHPDLFWYGIHGVEALYTIMGPGCESVTRVQTPDYELAVGVWKDGRVGTFRGLRQGKHDYGVTLYGSKATLHSDGFGGYKPLVAEIAKFFKTQKAPVSMAETLEIYAFMEAADESKRQGGRPVTLESVLSKARQTPGADAAR